MEDSSYDPNLTYEERRRLRKLKKEMKLQKVSEKKKAELAVQLVVWRSAQSCSTL